MTLKLDAVEVVRKCGWISFVWAVKCDRYTTTNQTTKNTEKIQSTYEFACCREKKNCCQQIVRRQSLYCNNASNRMFLSLTMIVYLIFKFFMSFLYIHLISCSTSRTYKWCEGNTRKRRKKQTSAKREKHFYYIFPLVLFCITWLR